MLGVHGWAFGCWYAYTPVCFADLQAGSIGLPFGRRRLVVTPGDWPWSRIGAVGLHVCLALVLLFTLAGPVLGQQERGGAGRGAAQAAPSSTDFSLTLPSSFAETRPGALGAALPGEIALRVWRKTTAPLAVVVRAAPLPKGTSLAQFVEMKHAARQSLAAYAEVQHAPTRLGDQPAIALESTYRDPVGQVLHQRDILVVSRDAGWAISWVHPEPIPQALRAEGEAIVSSFRFRPSAPPAVVEAAPRPEAQQPEPVPVSAPAPAPVVDAPPATPFSAPELVPLLAEHGATLVRDQRIVRLAAGEASARYTVLVPPQMARLAVAASWPGSVVEVALYRPDGELALLRRASQPPLVLAVDNPMSGQWAYAVTAVEVPEANYPVAVVAGLAPLPPAAVPAAPRPQPAAMAPPGLPRAGQPLPAHALAFLGVVLAETGLWLRRRLTKVAQAEDPLAYMG